MKYPHDLIAEVLWKLLLLAALTVFILIEVTK